MGNDAKIALVGAAVIFGAVAAYFIITAYGQDVTIDYEGQTVANIQLMHIQSLGMMIGLGSGIVSALFAVMMK